MSQRISIDQLKDFTHERIIARDSARGKCMKLTLSFNPELRNGRRYVHTLFSMVEVHDERANPSLILKSRSLEMAIDAYNALG